jgi:hypothetical protein
MKRALFALGQIMATPGAVEIMDTQGIVWLELAHRHVAGDWGDLDDQDKQDNDLSVQKEFRILSAYGRGEKRLWTITEADRSVTTILLPSEY